LTFAHHERLVGAAAHGRAPFRTVVDLRTPIAADVDLGPSRYLRDSFSGWCRRGCAGRGWGSFYGGEARVVRAAIGLHYILVDGFRCDFLLVGDEVGRLALRSSRRPVNNVP